MHKIKEMLMEELYEYEEKAKKMSGGKISAGDLETLHKLTDTVKNIDKIEMLEDGGYSEDGGRWEAMGSYEGGGNSYARGRGRNAKRDSRGRYSREEGGYSEEGGSYRGGSSYEGGGGMGGGSSYARGGQGGGSRGGGGRGGYSRGDAKEHLIEKLEDMMEEVDSEKDRMAIQQCIRKIENA